MASKLSQRDACLLMGLHVVVSQVFIRQEKDGEEFWAAEPIDPRPGWVVGLRYLPRGKAEVVDGDEDFFGRPSKVKAWVQTGKPEHALLVCFWPTEKPVPVPLDGYREHDPMANIEDAAHPPWPSAWGKTANAYSYNRGVQSGVSAEWIPSRDEKGRFKPWRSGNPAS